MSVLSASFLGSLHCLGMCGPLVCAAAPNRWLWWAYQVGRLGGYLFLGFIAGSLGRLVLNQLWTSVLPWASAFAIAGSFILLGVQIYRGRGFLKYKGPTFLSKVVKSRFSAAVPHHLNSYFFHHMGRVVNVFSVGFVSIFLPCGWLYGYVVAAVALGEPSKAVVFLFAFWLGTLPALAVSSLFFQKILISIQKIAPKTAGALLIVVGFIALGIKTQPLIESKIVQVVSPQKLAPSQNELMCH